MSLMFGEELMGFNGFVVNEFKDEKCSWTHPMKLVWFVTYDECKKKCLWICEWQQKMSSQKKKLNVQLFYN
jgi:hypothetical protein